MEDVRQVNEEYFRLQEYVKYEAHDKLINGLYAKRVVG